MLIHQSEIARLGIKTQEVIASTLNLDLVSAAALLQHVDAELWQLYSKASRAEEKEREYLAVLEVIYAAMLRAEQAAQEAAVTHMELFNHQIQNAIGIHPNVTEEPYLEAEMKRFELQLLQTLERLAQRMETLFHDAKNHDVVDEAEYKKIDPTQPLLEQVEAQVAYEELHMQGRMARRLDYYRQQQVGITHYIWRSQDDDKVRHRHAEYDDQVFAWANPPEGGHPGEAFNCRCWAEPSKHHIGEPKIALAPLLIIGGAAISAEQAAIILGAMGIAIAAQQAVVNAPPSVFSPGTDSFEDEEEIEEGEEEENAPEAVNPNPDEEPPEDEEEERKPQEDVRKDTEWEFGKHKSETKWKNQMEKRGWTEDEITEAIKEGDAFPEKNKMTNGDATRYVHPRTGRSVVRDNTTKEILQVGGDGFRY